MKTQADTIDTPAGTFGAPWNPTFPGRLAEMDTKEDLFEAARPNDRFLDPDVMAEIRTRGLVKEYEQWSSSDDRTQMEAFGDAILRMTEGGSDE